MVTIVGKTWDFHVTEVLRVSLEENLDMIAETVGYLASQGREVFYDAEHFFDGYAANPEYAAQTILRGRTRPGRSWSSSATPTAAHCPKLSPSGREAAAKALAP